METQDPIKDADIYHFNMDSIHARQADEFCQRVNDELGSLNTFKSFLNDIDYDDPTIQAVHGCIDGDQEIKAFGYDIFMNMFEEYCSNVVEL